MGTKHHPGEFDCFASAHPDEEMFVLLARDGQAPFLVEYWANTRMEKLLKMQHTWTQEKVSRELRKIQEARDCASRMRIQFTYTSKGEEPPCLYRSRENA